MATTIPTPAELAALAQQKLRSVVDPAGTGAVDLSPGSRNDNAISLNTALYTRVAQYVADRLTARSLATATGDDLDALVADVYQDARKPANAATGFVYLTRSVTTAPTVIPFGTRFATVASASSPAVVFTATQDVPVTTGQGAVSAPVAVPVECVIADETGNVAVSTITSILDALPDSQTWSLAAVPAGGSTFIAGGASAESDDTFRARIQQSAFDDSKKRGTKAAIQAGTLQVPGVTYVTVVEPGDGTILVFCGDANYNLSSSVQSAVQLNLEAWRAFGIPAIVRPYLVITVTVNATIYMQRPLQNYNAQNSPGSIQAQAVANVQTYFANRQRVDEFFGSAITAAMQAAHPEVQQVIINSLSVSGGPTPDGTNSVRRTSDALYGSVQSMIRYVVSTASLQVNVAPPLTN